MSWLTSKIQAEDVPILEKLASAARLRDKVDFVYRKKRGSDAGLVRRMIPEGAPEEDWELRPLFYMGLKLGSKAAFTPSGHRVFKGLNVFPSGLKGAPMGHWDRTTKPLDPKIYRYMDHFDHAKLFVSREIAQLPTIARVPSGSVFNNTVILIQMKEPFPLHGWVLSRPLMFVAATCLRATIVEDLVCHWYPKNLGLLPVPTDMTPQDRAELESAIEGLINADEDLANKWRRVQQLLISAQLHSVNQLIAAGSELTTGLTLPTGVDDAVPEDVELTDEGIESVDGTFSLAIPDSNLRAVIWYELHTASVAGTEVSQSSIGSLKIPNDPTAVANAIRDALDSDGELQFEAARGRLDLIAAKLLGLDDADLTHIQERFLSDPFLSQIRPMWAHRGLHVQGYHDHSGGDRFA